MKDGYGFTYDAAERLTQQTGLFGMTLNYTNDANGNVVQVTDSAGGTVTSVYDANNRLGDRGRASHRIKSLRRLSDQSSALAAAGSGRR